MRIPEAFRVHQEVIDWNRKFSPTGIPAGAVGLNSGTLKVMRWAMQDWSRMELVNRLFGTLGAAVQLDYIPGLASAAFVSLRLTQPLHTDAAPRTTALLRAGMSIQRFWLTATSLGLAMQPSLATLIFAYYGRSEASFTADGKAPAKARRLNGAVAEALGDLDNVVFLGRLGKRRARLPGARSVRLSLAELIRPAAVSPSAEEASPAGGRS